MSSLHRLAVPLGTWAALAGCQAPPSSMVQVTPSATTGQLHNPGMGVVFYCGDTCGHMIPDEADILYTSNLTWSQVEPSRGVYDWSIVTGILKVAQASGRRVAVRLATSWQNTPYPTPAWLTDPSMGGTVPLLNDAEPSTLETAPSYILEPEWWHPDYVPAFQAMVGAFGAGFDGMPGLEYVDLRVYGWWGEGHRWHATTPWPADVDRRGFLVAATDTYYAAFPHTPLVVETASDVPQPPPALQYPYDTAIDHALSRGAWMRRDGFGAYINTEEAALLDASWQTSLVIAEPGAQYAKFLAGTVVDDQTAGHPIATIDHCIDEMLAHHINYFPVDGASDFAALQAARPDLLAKAIGSVGYHFTASSASWESRVAPAGALHVQSSWHNGGVGRLPFARALAAYVLDASGNVVVSGVDGAFDPTALVQGSDAPSTIALSIPASTSAGAYSVAFAMVDPATMTPSIQLAMQGDDGQKRYVVGAVTVPDPSSMGQ